MSTQNCVYKLGCVDCDAFYIGESSREISTRAKQHIRYTKKPPNNPVELDRLQMKWAIAAHTIFNNHQIDFKNIKILQKDFSNYKERRVAEAFHIMLNPTALNRKEGLTICPMLNLFKINKSKLGNDTYNVVLYL
ncbi:hypothetical protein Smp_043250 [Schistosoma mansoni]|uniref:GIY-YIG domain-containing protein n=1 Tax=Schistosoma mansoni TaxID=6183 RepID=G4VIY0_SCHMA|nr:hypothetical protein Smp_043250 [Schistosoma mansoni]|eukprot:XP_018651986.1 hypothetical protein Smp_043250 [Schistosoma mansoni]